jgi:thioredoxin 1
MRQLLAKDDSWYQGPAPSNVVQVASMDHFRHIIQRAGQSSIVVADFFAPNCYACRSMWPKMKQLASSNPDVTFAMINTSLEQLGDLANILGVAKLPWFVIFDGRSGERRASFTANLRTISVIRAEIAAAKECTAPQCLVD